MEGGRAEGISFKYDTGKSKSEPGSTQSCYLFYRKGKANPKNKVFKIQALPVTEGLVALYAKDLLLDQFEFLNDH